MKLYLVIQIWMCVVIYAAPLIMDFVVLCACVILRIITTSLSLVLLPGSPQATVQGWLWDVLL